MAIMATAKQISLPEDGPHLAVIVDIYDIGLIVNKFNGLQERKIRIYFSLKDVNPINGFNYTVSQAYTLSLHKKSNLAKMLKCIGIDTSKPIDMESLIGTVAMVQTIRDGEYANLAGVYMAPKDAVLQLPGNYTRRKDREQEQKLASKTKLVNPITADGDHDSDIPF